MIKFYKYQATGNDFIMIDNRDGHFPIGNIKLIQKICARRTGIGADGLILLEQPHQAGDDFYMQYFNADGSESGMCGNGGRAIVAFAKNMDVIEKECAFSANDGPHKGRVIDENTTAVQLKDTELPLTKGNDYFVNTGSPHHVQLVDNVQSVDVFSEGRKVRYSDEYMEEGTNVNFIQYKDGVLEVATYERGVEDETLSCGTGVTASAIIWASKRGLPLDEKHTIPILSKGGSLSVSFIPHKKGFKEVWLEGPAVMVYEAVVN